MPFACSILEEFASEYIQLDQPSQSYKFMTLCAQSTAKGSQLLSAGIHPSDMTCRPQLVHKDDNSLYHSLISEFGNLTGVYALLNTSLNQHGKPIISKYIDLLQTLDEVRIDGVLTENYFAFR